MFTTLHVRLERNDSLPDNGLLHVVAVVTGLGFHIQSWVSLPSTRSMSMGVTFLGRPEQEDAARSKVAAALGQDTVEVLSGEFVIA